MPKPRLFPQIPEEPGVYALINTRTGYWYIGSSLSMRKRVMTHFALLRSYKHTIYKLQSDYHQHGPASFEVRVLVKSPALLTAAEQLCISRCKAPLYNISRTAARAEGRQQRQAYLAKARHALVQDLYARIPDTRKRTWRRAHLALLGALIFSVSLLVLSGLGLWPSGGFHGVGQRLLWVASPVLYLAYTWHQTLRPERLAAQQAEPRLRVLKRALRLTRLQHVND